MFQLFSYVHLKSCDFPYLERPAGETPPPPIRDVPCAGCVLGKNASCVKAGVSGGCSGCSGCSGILGVSFGM